MIYVSYGYVFFFFNDTATTEIYTLSLHDALPISFELVFPVDQFLERLPDEADLERGTSFAENAVAKARYFAKRGTIPTLAEDSRLEVDALEGAPGVFSARWAERSEEHTSELQSRLHLVCRLLLEKKK